MKFLTYKKNKVLNYLVISITICFVILPVVLFLSSGEVLAQDGTGLKDTCTAAGLPCGDGSIAGIIGTIIYAVLSFLGVVFIILLIYGGFLRMTAQGNPDQIKKSMGVITSAVIGVIIIFASYTITAFVLSHIGASVGNGNDGLGGGTDAVGCCELTYTVAGISGDNFQQVENITSAECTCTNTLYLIGLDPNNWATCSASWISGPCP